MLDNQSQDASDDASTSLISLNDQIKSLADKFNIERLTSSSFNGTSASDLQHLTNPASATVISTHLGSNTGSNGYTLTSNGGTSLGATWQSPNVWATTGSVNTVIGANSGIRLSGESADIVVNNKSIMKTLERIEDRLNLLEINPELEKDWDDLRRLGERYRKLEKKCKQKAETWKKLKAMPPPIKD